MHGARDRTSTSTRMAPPRWTKCDHEHHHRCRDGLLRLPCVLRAERRRHHGIWHASGRGQDRGGAALGASWIAGANQWALVRGGGPHVAQVRRQDGHFFSLARRGARVWKTNEPCGDMPMKDYRLIMPVRIAFGVMFMAVWILAHWLLGD